MKRAEGRTSHNSGATTSTTDTATLHGVRADSLEHGCLLKHVWDDDESDHRSTDVNCLKSTLLSISSGDCDVLQTDIQTVLGCTKGSERDKEKASTYVPSYSWPR